MKKYEVLMSFVRPSLSVAKTELEEHVDVAMLDNWKTTGGISIIVSNDYPAHYILAQAMIKEEI